MIPPEDWMTEDEKIKLAMDIRRRTRQWAGLEPLPRKDLGNPWVVPTPDPPPPPDHEIEWAMRILQRHATRLGK